MQQDTQHQDNSTTEKAEHAKPNSKKIAGFLLVILTILIGTGIGFIGWLNYEEINKIVSRPTTTPPPEPSLESISSSLAKFDSPESFTQYLTQSMEYSAGFGAGIGRAALDTQPMIAEFGADPLAAPSQADERYISQTNVQIQGIDEPDIVKTDGNTLYISSDRMDWWRGIEPVPMPEPDQILLFDPESETFEEQRSFSPPQEPQQRTSLVNPIPPETMERLNQLDIQGELLLHESNLVILAGSKVVAYDVLDPRNPNLSWQFDLEDNQHIVTARHLDNYMYLVAQSFIDHSQPCPLPFVKRGAQTLTIDCTNIYHPIRPTSIDAIFTAMKVDITNGDIASQTSIVGSAHSSVVSMSRNKLYLTHTHQSDIGDFYAEFLLGVADELLDSASQDRVRQVKGYKLSSQAKLTELMHIVQTYQSSLPADRQREFEAELTNQATEFASDNLRRFEQTSIVSFSLGDLSVTAQGIVPGRPLNQFSVDEHNNHVRIATTVSSNSFMFSNESANDVYVLNQDLQKEGSVIDLGLTERIFAVRFIGDVAYVVTFRQIDPFYTLDLSDPSNPQMTGELKIPGFSSYLHPLDDDLILGVGQEEGRVKLSLFDVSDMTDPREVSVYHLDEYYSEVGNNHRAFTHDSANDSFFIPASRNAYMFTYQDKSLSLTRVIDQPNIRRAVIIDDALYLIAPDQVTALSRNDFTEISRLRL